MLSHYQEMVVTDTNSNTSTLDLYCCLGRVTMGFLPSEEENLLINGDVAYAVPNVPAQYNIQYCCYNQRLPWHRNHRPTQLYNSCRVAQDFDFVLIFEPSIMYVRSGILGLLAIKPTDLLPCFKLRISGQKYWQPHSWNWNQYFNVMILVNPEI